MRNRIDRKWRKRVLSVAVVFAMVLAMVLPELGLPLVSEAAAPKEYLAVTTSGVVKKAVRGVVDKLEDLPQVKFGDGWQNEQVGTANRPFTILEIAPYEEFGQIGYLIRGCEPVRLEDLGGTPDSDFNWGNLPAVTGGGDVGIVTAASGGKYTAYFFTDEPQGQRTYYGNKFTESQWNDETGLNGENDKVKDFYVKKNVWDDTIWVPDNYSASGGHYGATVDKEYVYSKELKGYYEVVDDGKGVFSAVEIGGKRILTKEEVPDGKKNIVWHTINVFDEEMLELEGRNITYASAASVLDLDDRCLQNKGDLYYAYRKSSKEDPYVDVSEANLYHFYYNKDGFVTDVIGLPLASSSSYSVVVKTITPAELNDNPNWVDYADLIYITPTTHNDDYISLWKSKAIDGKPANRLGRQVTDSTTSGYTHAFVGTDMDISYDVMKKIFYKATALKNYVGVVFDWTFINSYTTDDGKKSCVYKIYDYNFNVSKVFKSFSEGNVDRTFNGDGYSYNIAKLWLMLTCENPNIIKKMFWDKNKIKEQDGKAVVTTQEGDAALYWDEVVFMLVDPDQDIGEDTNNLMNKDSYWWNAYKATDNSTGKFSSGYVFSHTYTFKSDNSLTQSFLKGSTGVNSKDFGEFNEYVATDETTREVWKRRNKDKDYDSTVGQNGQYSNNIPPSAALRYILDLGDDTSLYFDGELKVLNVEPSVGLDTHYNPIWKEENLKQKIQMLLPDYTGDNSDISVTSMTMSTFVGITDDLNNYDLIYFGQNSDGFWKGQGSNQSKTDFHDDAMDGMLYFHMGDTMTGGKEKSGSQIKRTAQFIEGASDETLRFPGNDITHLMIRKLEDYMAAGHPVIAENLLFSASDSSSYMQEFLNNHYVSPETSMYGEGSKRLFKLEGARIEENVRNAKITVNFDEVPRSFVEGNDSSYLNPDGGAAVLTFKVKIPTDNGQTGQFAYNLYVDQDRNAKFETGEKVKSGMSLAVGVENEITYSLSSEIVGFVQWRLEVYRQDNKKLMKSVEGGSAIKRNASKEKEKIHVLQILPNSGTVTANLKDPEYAGLYANLDAFEIEVDTITLGELDEIFEAAGGFTFQAGSEISTENPSVDQLKNLNDKYSEKYETKYGTARSLDYYNMIVVGFADAYGGTDITNENGLVEYLYYFAAKDMSILFTHDNTSLYNGSNAVGSMGYTANAMMRDIMGMNRYGVNTLNSGTNGIVSAEWLNAYRAKVQAKYTHEDGTTDFEYDKAVFNGSELTGLRQGFTINALRKAGYNDDASGGRLPYMYMVKDANGGNEGTNEYITEIHESQNGEKSPITSKTGFFTSSQVEKEGETTRANRVNMGQITQYPYNIGDDASGIDLTIAPTHAQWYLLNMEDPEVTVWYTLGYNGTSASYAKIYAASPMDVANNYYIYSKGNIFYSGVGHSDTEGAGGSEEERQLFINTMIAAYRRGAQPPEIVVTNANKVNGSSSADYMIRVLQELDQDDSGNAVAGEALDGSSVRVVFKAVDISLAQDIMVHIESGNGIVITEIKPYNWEGVSLTKGDDGFIHKLENEKEYYFDYEKSNLTAAGGSIITFTTKNDKIDETGETKLEIKPQPLVLLD